MAVACTSVVPVPSLPADASPTQVLEAYLATVKAGNCAGAQTFETPKHNGPMCNGAQLESYGPLSSGDPALYGNNAEFCLPVTVSGDQVYGAGFSSDCFVLTQQPDGRWLVAGDGPGP